VQRHEAHLQRTRRDLHRVPKQRQLPYIQARVQPGNQHVRWVHVGQLLLSADTGMQPGNEYLRAVHKQRQLLFSDTRLQHHE
jgi:hypothetical protein